MGFIDFAQRSNTDETQKPHNLIGICHFDNLKLNELRDNKFVIKCCVVNLLFMKHQTHFCRIKLILGKGLQPITLHCSWHTNYMHDPSSHYAQVCSDLANLITL